MFSLKNKKKKAIGLDIGSSSIKTVELLKTNDSNISLLSCKQLKLKSEGILDEDELSRSLSSWLHQSYRHEYDLCLGIPHYLATIQVREFPKTSDDNLKNMISYETIQLAGISEEEFIYDYHVMSPQSENSNPVLIGISRASIINEKLKILQKAGIQSTDIALNSIAILNTLFHLKPEIKSINAPQIILEIGAENSLLIIFSGTQIISINSLLFGAEKFTKAIADELKLDPSKAEEEKNKSRIDPLNKEHPLYKTAINLLSEINNTLEQWRIHENSQFQNNDFVKIWLTGGGANTKGLNEFLKLNFRHAQIETFGPPDESGKVSPEFSVAFGLALQALKSSTIKISLAPLGIKWFVKKKNNAHFISAALIFFSISTAIFLFTIFLNLKIKDSHNKKIILRLKKCEELIPQIQDTNNEIKYYEKMLLPLAATGNNIPKIISALNELNKASNQSIIFSYLADSDSFNSFKQEQAKSQNPNTNFFTYSPTITKDEKSTDTIVSPVENVKEITSLIIYGYTLSPGKNDHFELVRSLQSKLDKSNFFGSQGKSIDLLPDEEKKSIDLISQHWTNKILNNKTIHSALGRKRFREFAFSLPFKYNSISLPSEPPKQK